MEERIGFIYILTNKAFPHLLKIGYTLMTVEERVQELSSATGVPYKFKIAHIAETFSPEKKEAIIHNYFSKYRVSEGKKNTEFFKIDLKRAIDVVSKVVNPPNAPIPPEPPERTYDQMADRKNKIEAYLKFKFDNRIKNIYYWLQAFEESLIEETKVQNIRKKRGAIKRCLIGSPKADDRTLYRIKNLIEKVRNFNKSYTYEIFMKEHSDVHGVDQISHHISSGMLNRKIGIINEESIVLDTHPDSDLFHKIIEFQFTESFPFRFREIYTPNQSPHAKSLHDWDEHFMIETWFNLEENY
jgi:hypothetical protein